MLTWTVSQELQSSGLFGHVGRTGALFLFDAGSQGRLRVVETVRRRRDQSTAVIFVCGNRVLGLRFSQLCSL